MRKGNTFALMLGTRVVTLRDGTVCWSRSKTAAMRDMRQFVREWRGEIGQTAAMHPSGYELKRNRSKSSAGILRIVEIKEDGAQKERGWYS